MKPVHASLITAVLGVLLAIMVGTGQLHLGWALAILGWSCMANLWWMHLRLRRDVMGFIERLSEIGDELKRRLIPRPRAELPRITVSPARMGGVPCVRMRMPVMAIVRMVANGLSVEQIIDLHPDLEREDVLQAMQYAAAQLAELGDPAERI